MKLKDYIREMVEAELNEMAAIARLEKIKSPEKLEKFKKLYAGNENDLTSKLIDTIEKGSYRVVNVEKAESNPKYQEVIDWIWNNFNKKPGNHDPYVDDEGNEDITKKYKHPIPTVVLEKAFSDVSDLVSAGILSKVDGATRNGLLAATNKSHTAGISPNLRQLNAAGVLVVPKEEGEYIVPKKEKPESSGVKGRPTSEKTLMAKELKSKLEADANYKPSEDEIAMLGTEFIEQLRSRINGTLQRGRKSALQTAMKAMMASKSDDEDLNDDGIIDDEDLDVEKLEEDKNLNENMTLDANKLKSFMSSIKSFGGSKYDKQDFIQIAKLLASNNLAKAADMITLLDTSPHEWIVQIMLETYPELYDILFEDDPSGYIALAKPRTGLNENKKQSVNEQFLKMQKLAGLITESEFKSKLNKN